MSVMYQICQWEFKYHFNQLLFTNQRPTVHQIDFPSCSYSLSVPYHTDSFFLPQLKWEMTQQQHTTTATTTTALQRTHLLFSRGQCGMWRSPPRLSFTPPPLGSRRPFVFPPTPRRRCIFAIRNIICNATQSLSRI